MNEYEMFTEIADKKIQLIFFICITVYLFIRQKLGNPYYQKTHSNIQKTSKIKNLAVKKGRS